MKPVSSKLLYRYVCQLVIDISPTTFCTFTGFFAVQVGIVVVQIGLLSYKSYKRLCSINRTAGFVIRLLTKLAAYNAGRLQICRNDWPERKTVVDKRYALRNSVGVIPVRDLNMVVKYSALSK